MSREPRPDSPKSSNAKPPPKPEEDDSDFTLVVNRKKQQTDSCRKPRQSQDYDQDDHHSNYTRRRKYRDRGGDKSFRKKKADKENIQKTVAQAPAPPQPQPPSSNMTTTPPRSFSVVVAGLSAIPKPASSSTTIITTSQPPDPQPPVLTTRQILLAVNQKEPQQAIPSTSSSIPDTSSMTSDETTDSIERKASSADVESNEGSTTPAVEYVDAPAPKINPWVVNRNAAQVLKREGPIETFTEKSPEPKKDPQKTPAPPQDKQPAPPPTPQIQKQQKPVHDPPKPKQPITQELPEDGVSQDPLKPVYIRENQNGFRPGRGRGSYSGTASCRKIPSRTSVLTKIIITNERPDDWPTLDEALTPRTQKLSSSENDDYESYAELKKTEDVVDSHADKRPQVKSADAQSKTENEKTESRESPEPPPPQQSETTCSSDNDDDVNSPNKRKGSKQKWVPLDITPQQEQRGGTETQPQEQKKPGKTKRYNNQGYGGYQRAKGKENMGVNGDRDYSDYTYSPRYNRQQGGLRSTPQMNPRAQQPVNARPRRHHPTPHNHHHHHLVHHRSNSTLSLNNTPALNGTVHHHGYEILSPTSASQDFQDFAADFTITPMYPAVSEFIMPYVTNGYFPTPFTPPAGVIIEQPADVVAAGAIVVHGSATAAHIHNDIAILTDLVRTQIEYYFSEENLTKDFYLRRKMDDRGYLPINLIATFPRVKQMTENYATVLTAIQSSESLELKQDMSSVRTRITPEKWPIPETRSLSSSSDTTDKTCINNNIQTGLETLNPNVPEFVPKSRVFC